MDIKVKDKWYVALTSGEYEQGTGQLKTGSNKFCCYGVLCDLYKKETGKGRWIPQDDGSFYIFFETSKSEDNAKNKFGTEYGSSIVIPEEVQKWAGLTEHSPAVIKDGEMVYLSEFNDSGTSFNKIAELIKDQL